MLRTTLPALLLVVVSTACAGSDGEDSSDPASDSEDALTASATCDAAHPVKLVVGLEGQDGASVNGLVGIDLVDAHGTAVTRDGAPNPNRKTYPIILGFNKTYGAEGKPNGTFGETRSITACVGSNIARAYLEAYPKNPGGITDRTKYGETVYQYLTVHGAGSYPVGLRFPVVSEWAAAHGVKGGTGNIFGHVVCNGAPAIPDHAQLRVWSAEPGPDCGLRAYSASADASNEPAYKFSALAGGQCFAPSQPVNAYIRGNCGGRYRQVVKRVDIITGKTIPVNVDLATGTDEGPAR